MHQWHEQAEAKWYEWGVRVARRVRLWRAKMAALVRR
jgi:hypothetical protein